MNIVEIAPMRRVTIPPVKSLVPQAIPAKSAKTAAKRVEFNDSILSVSPKKLLRVTLMRYLQWRSKRVLFSNLVREEEFFKYGGEKLTFQGLPFGRWLSLDER